MNDARIPRGLVGLVATLIIGAPACLVLAADYRTDGQGRVIHHHTDDYTVSNGVGGGDATLQEKVEQARQSWDDAGAARKTVRATATSDSSTSQIHSSRRSSGALTRPRSWVRTP